MVPDAVFQSPRGDFGFLKASAQCADNSSTRKQVSIPSRGFWFFEAITSLLSSSAQTIPRFQSPRGDFGFLKVEYVNGDECVVRHQVSIPSRGFWFFEAELAGLRASGRSPAFQSPRGDFGFLKTEINTRCGCFILHGFNPLAGILVF